MAEIRAFSGAVVLGRLVKSGWAVGFWADGSDGAGPRGAGCRRQIGIGHRGTAVLLKIAAVSPYISIYLLKISKNLIMQATQVPGGIAWIQDNKLPTVLNNNHQ